MKSLIRAIVPFEWRVALVRARRRKSFDAEAGQFALGRDPAAAFPFLVTEHSSPLRRPGTTYGEELQRGKETNVALVASHLDGLILPVGGVFSYHHAVGQQTKVRGFVLGAELHDGDLKPGIGGGACQVSNLLYVLALYGGATIVERHRHGLDLFPDSERTIPFGCGATVFFPTADLRFRNDLSVSLRLEVSIVEGTLRGRMWASNPVGMRFEIVETESGFREDAGRWIRENRIVRRTLSESGTVLGEEEVAHNVARCRYRPEGA